MHEEPTEAAPPTEAPAPPAGPGRAHRVTAWLLSGLGVAVVVVVLAGFFVHLPYAVISPGSASPLDSSVVTIEGAPTYEHDGEVLYLTVRVSGSDPTVWKLVTSWLDPDKEVVERESVVGCLSDTENIAYNTRLMQQSQDDATKVALERLGDAVTASAPEVVITDVSAGGVPEAGETLQCDDAPATGVLRAGDQIVAIDDQPVTALEDVSRLIDASSPGDVVRVTVVRDGATETLDVTTGGRESDGGPCLSDARGSASPCLGIAVQSFVQYDFPIDVDFDLARVGGPSAGLAFTLAIIDDLTPGDLTGGARVAVTGAIASDGSVLPVGGVEQKATTARTNDVDLMIVPRAEVAQARRGAEGLRVVGVDTIDDALAALERAGGAPVPPPTSTPARS
jgi:PDZ domain-containing protein